VALLLEQVREALGLTAARGVVVVGAGNLGRALANYSGFEERGFPVRAIVDADPAKVGARVGRVVVHHADELPELVVQLGLRIGVIAVPSATAQDAADRLVAAGLHALLNFAPSLVSAPDEVAMRHVDLALELEVLSFYERQLGTVAAVEGPA
jgi:redox-sensing transcriptional repressor